MKQNNEQDWSPAYIEIEDRFAEFVATFREGSRVADFSHGIPPGILNADFYLPHDKVIVELKCLEKDPSDPEALAMRVASSFQHLGYTGSDFFGWLFRGEPLPASVAKRVFAAKARSVIEAIKKANKQIRATKYLLNEPSAQGLVLVANDQNFGFTPEQMLSVIARAFFAMPDCHVDCVVYLTPNVYHDIGDDVARTLWIPIYNVGSESFSNFVNNFGAAWISFAEALGTPYLVREARDDLPGEIATAMPIAIFRKGAKK